MSLFGCSKSVKEGIKQILINQRSIFLHQHELKELIMGYKEDFAGFVESVDQRTNEIGTALDEIKTDIEGLINPATPEAVAAQMQNIVAKLDALSTSAKDIASINDPAVPAVPEEPAATKEDRIL
jgi:hypothetical protein